MERPVVSRRVFLAGLGAAVAGTVLTACAPAAAPEATSAPATKPAEQPKPTEAPKPTQAPLPTSAQAATQPTAAASQVNSSKAKGKVTLLVVSNPQNQKGEEQILEPAIKKQLPDVQFERIVVPADQYNAKINAVAAAKEPLEMWGFGYNYFDFWARGLAQELDSYIKADAWDAAKYFSPGLMDIFTVKGKPYGLPQTTTYGSVTVYNKDLFDKAGLKYPTVDWGDKSWNHDVLLDYSLKLSSNWGKPDATYGLIYTLPASMTGIPLAWGGDPWLPEHYTNLIAPKTNFGCPESIEGHQFKLDLIYKHKVHPDPAVQQGLGQIGLPFKTGKVAMTLDHGGLYTSTSDITDFKFGFAPIPWSKSDKSRFLTFTNFWLMASWSTNKDAAWQVMRLFSQLDVAKDYAVLTGTPPAVAGALDAWLESVSKRTGQSIDDLKKVTLGALETKRAQESPDHIFLQHRQLMDRYNQEITALWRNDGPAKDIVPKVAQSLDSVALSIYNQFKDTMPKQ